MLAKVENSPKLICTFTDGPKIELMGQTGDIYCVTIEEKIPEGFNRVMALHEFREQTWYKFFREWRSLWKICVWGFDYQEGVYLIDEHMYNEKDKKVQINIDTEEFQEAIEWLLQAISYKKQVGCHLYISSHFNDIFKPMFPDVEGYIAIEQVVPDCYAKFNIGKYPVRENGPDRFGRWGCRENRVLDGMHYYDSFKNPKDWKDIPNQQVATDILGIEYSYIDPLGQITSLLPKEKDQDPIDIICHFVNGPYVEIFGNDKDTYFVEFIDSNSPSFPVYSVSMESNHWAKSTRVWYTDWQVNIKTGGNILFQHKMDLTDKRVLIVFDSKSLGDTIAWFPYAEEFRKKHKCHLIATTFWNDLFAKNYPDIEFSFPGVIVPNLYASYVVGCWDGDYDRNKVDWRLCPLQKIATDILGLEYQEVRPKIVLPEGTKEIKEKYVAISEHATARCKYWNYDSGWQQIVNYLASIGYKTVVISKEKSSLTGVIDRTDRSIESTINTLRYADLYMGVSSGPSWLAWAIGTPTVIISGTTEKFVEFKENNTRIINESVCHGCFDDPAYKFDRGDWNWCPHFKDFECTRSISPAMVIEAIRPLLIKK